jgi:hypothetical protein
MSRSRFRFLTVAAAGALTGLMYGAAPAAAEEPLARSGPVGPYEPILTKMGSKRLIAFYVPDSGRCGVSAVIFDAAAPDAPYAAARVRTTLWPGETFHLDGAQRDTIDLRCGDNAANLALSGPAERANTGATR